MLNFQDIERAVLSVFSFAEDGDLLRRGSAFAVTSTQLITCEHVVSDACMIGIVADTPAFGCDRMCMAKIVASDRIRDLALLSVPTFTGPLLKLFSLEQLDLSVPLVVWAWPGWNKYEASSAPANAQRLKVPHCAPRAAVLTRQWPGTKVRPGLFTFAAHVEEGMSGGPAVSALTGEVVGVVRNVYQPPGHLGEDWRDSLELLEIADFSDALLPLDELIDAQLGLAIGIALPAQELSDFLERYS